MRDDTLFGRCRPSPGREQGRLKLLAYHHDNRGQGHWWAPGQPSYLGTDRMLPISIRSTNYTINRDGLTAALSWTVGNHELEAGLWYEQNDHNVSRNFYYISGPFLDDLYLKNPDRLLFNQDFDIRTRQFYVQDRMRFLGQRLTWMWASARTPHARHRQAGRGNPHRSGTLTAKESVPPQVGLGRSAPTTSCSPPTPRTSPPSSAVAAALAGVAGIVRGQRRPEPEKSKSLEAGFRTFGEKYQASIAAYNVKFDNRLLSLNPCSSIEVGTRPECVTRFINVGSVKSHGAELTFILKPIDGLQWYNALSWNKTTYEDDYTRAVRSYRWPTRSRWIRRSAWPPARSAGTATASPACVPSTPASATTPTPTTSRCRA